MKTILLALGASLLAVGTAHAATASGTMNTQIAIVDDCSISATDMNFGSLGLLRSAKDATATLTIKCTPNLAYSVKLYDANDATATSYVMKNATNDGIHFSMYTDASRSVLWNSTEGKSGLGDGLTQTVTIYGRIPAQPAKPAGAYTLAVRGEITF